MSLSSLNHRGRSPSVRGRVAGVVRKLVSGVVARVSAAVNTALSAALSAAVGAAAVAAVVLAILVAVGGAARVLADAARRDGVDVTEAADAEEDRKSVV